MEIIKNNNNGALTVKLIGRLDTNTSMELDKAVSEELNVNSVVLDLKDLIYISSAGLRVVLTLHKKYSKLGGFKVLHPSVEVMEVFDMTAFSNFLSIED